MKKKVNQNESKRILNICQDSVKLPMTLNATNYMTSDMEGRFAT